MNASNNNDNNSSSPPSPPSSPPALNSSAGPPPIQVTDPLHDSPPPTPNVPQLNTASNTITPPSNESTPNTNVSAGGKRKRNEPPIIITVEGEDLYALSKRAKFETPEEMDMEKDSGEEDNTNKLVTPEKKLNEPIWRLRSQLESVLVKLPKPPTRSSQVSDIWGKLYPQFQGQSPVSLSGMVFTIGRSPRCNLPIKDPVVNGVLCRLHYVQGKAFIESMSGSGILSLNHRIMRKQVKLHLRDGDEISITGNQTYSYIFNQIKTTTNGSDIDDTLSLPTKPTKLSSFSRPPYRPLISQMISDTKSIEKLTSTLNISATTTNSSQVLPASNVSIAPALAFMDSMNEGHVTESTDMISSSSAQIPALEMSDVEKSPEKSDTEINAPSEKGAEYRSQLMQKIEDLFISSDQLTVTFDQFPYYLSDNVKNMLINAAFIYLEKPQFTKYTKSIPTLSRRIQLSGQKGTEFLQEKLVQALANHFKAKLLVLDDCFQENQKTDDLSSSTTLSLLDDVSLSNTFESTVPNPRCAFKKGDKVRFVGSNNSGLNSASLTGFFVPSREDSKKLSFSSSSNTINPLSSSRPSNTPRHGPSVGYWQSDVNF